MESVDDSYNRAFFFVLGALELCVNALEFPASAVNILLVSRTSLIHPNMKFILLNQSVCILMRGSCRFATCVLKFALWAPVSSESIEPWRTLYNYSYINRNFCSHVLIIERVMATVWAKSYEQSTNWSFTLCWATIVNLASLYNTFAFASADSTLPNVVTAGILCSLGILEFGLFIWLNFFNKRVYVQKMVETGAHNLSERYQLTENIRIGRQLVPTLALHLWTLVTSTFVLFYGYFGSAHMFTYLLTASKLSASFCGLMIEVTMITFHPFLKRNLFALLSRLHRKNKIDDISPKHGVSEANKAIALRDIINGRLLNNSRTDDYFDQLKRAWGDASMRRLSHFGVNE